jgi:hypothetical protein
MHEKQLQREWRHTQQERLLLNADENQKFKLKFEQVGVDFPDARDDLQAAFKETSAKLLQQSDAIARQPLPTFEHKRVNINFVLSSPSPASLLPAQIKASPALVSSEPLSKAEPSAPPPQIQPQPGPSSSSSKPEPSVPSDSTVEPAMQVKSAVQTKAKVNPASIAAMARHLRL